MDYCDLINNSKTIPMFNIYVGTNSLEDVIINLYRRNHFV